ncbi:MAG: sodium:solute symporter family protein [Proteobacteria bacterium]|nr:sodium:solute symporter family protein [Pseudomonadota bacterium]
MNAALVLIALFVVGALALALLARRGRKMSLEQWALGGRGMGTVMVFLLMAGESFSTFTFLGASGWSYSKGAPAFYILAYGGLAYLMAFWMLPAVWRYATANKLVSFSDFWAHKYNSRALGVVVSVVALAGMVALLTIQLRGLGIIVSEASYGSIAPQVSIWIGAVVMVSYILVSGIHGSANIAIVKDLLILGLAVFLGIYLPWHYYGGVTPMFEAIHAQRPDFFSFPKEGLNLGWYNSTILLTALGYYLYPFNLTSVYAAKSASAVRRNTILMPLYQIVIAFLFIVGFAAILKVPGLQGAEVDLALFGLVKATFDPWFVGLIGGTGVLTALVPGSMILLTASTVIGRNVYKEGFAPQASDRQVARVARVALPLFALVAVYFVMRGGSTIVSIAIFASSLLTQLLPSLLFSLMPRPFGTRHAAFAGIAAGAAVLGASMLSGVGLPQLLPHAPAAVKSINLGLVALACNALAFVLVATLGPRPATPRFAGQPA